MKILHHLTVNTGHVAQTTRDRVKQSAIDKLLPLIDNEGGEFPAIGMMFDLYRPLDQDNDHRPVNGGAIFQIGPINSATKPYVVCFACWEKILSESAWLQCREANLAFAPVLKQINLYRPTDEMPPPVPWLAVIILPTIATLDPDRALTLGDMERCLFWAMAEGSK